MWNVNCEQLYLLPLWVCLWVQRPLLLANVLGHWSQDFWCAIFSLSLWMREWIFKLSALPNDLLHCVQLYLLPLWVFLWRERPLLPANVLRHWSQDFRSAIFDDQPLFPTLFPWLWKIIWTMNIDYYNSIWSLSLSPKNVSFLTLFLSLRAHTGDIIRKLKDAFDWKLW